MARRTARSVCIVFFLLTGISLRAQTTTASVAIDETGVGCQGGGGVLTGGVHAAANLTVHYDATTAVLQLVVANDTPVVPGEPNAVLTQVCVNLPPLAVDAAVLLGAVGSGGATPDFHLTFDDDTAVAPDPNAFACLGSYNLRLATVGGLTGGIANPLATVVAAPAPVIGPVTFDIQLFGPGVHGIDAAAVLASYSQGASQDTTNAAAKFEAGGPGGTASGFLGSGDLCRTGVYVVGTPEIGQTVNVCVTGDQDCHVCLWGSFVEGPVVVTGITIPIGLPVLAVLDYGNLGGGLANPVCLTVPIPNDPIFVGTCLYFTNLTYPWPNTAAFSFSPAHELCVGSANPQSTICGYKFFDHNEDGTWNPGVDPLEVPIEGWRIELWRGTVLDGVTYTDAAGRYCFVRNQDNTVYTVREVAPGGFIGENIPGAIWLAKTPRSGTATANAATVAGPTFGNLSFELTPGVGRTKGFWHNMNGRALLNPCDPDWRHDLYVRRGLPVGLRTNVSTADPAVSLLIPPFPTTTSPPPAFFALPFLDAHAVLAEWLVEDAFGHAGFILSTQVAASILSNSCGFMQGTIYVDRFQNGILVSFDEMVAGATALLSDPHAGQTGPNDPYQELREMMLMCTNEFGTINNSGDLGEPQTVYGPSGAPRSFRFPY